MEHSLRDCPLSTYAKFSVRVAFFTPCFHESTRAYQGDKKCCFWGDFADIPFGWSLSRLNYGISLELDL